MKVYKERHMKYSFSLESEWEYRDGKIKGRIYNGPIVYHRGRAYAGTKMTPEVEKKWRLIPRRWTGRDAIDYDSLKPRYKMPFIFPKQRTHALTEKEEKAGKYTRYFMEFNNEIFEIDKKDHKYYRKKQTAYHIGCTLVELKMELSIEGLHKNKAMIAEANKIIPGIDTLIKPDEYMELSQFLFTGGGLLQRLNGEEYAGYYHIHPEHGPMEGKVHTSDTHENLIWIGGEDYRPKGLAGKER